MPLYQSECVSCGRRDEHLLRVGEPLPHCSCPSASPQRLVISTIAFTPGRWGDSHGYYSAALGKYIQNDSHRDRLCKEMNVVPLSDFGDARADSVYDARVREDKALDRYMATYDKALSEGAATIHAIEAAKEASDDVR